MEDFAEDGVGVAWVGDKEGLVGGTLAGKVGRGLFTILDRWMAESEM